MCHIHMANQLAMWLICLLIRHVDVAHGYFAYVNKISFAYPEHLVHGGVAPKREMNSARTDRQTNKCTVCYLPASQSIM